MTTWDRLLLLLRNPFTRLQDTQVRKRGTVEGAPGTRVAAAGPAAHVPGDLHRGTLGLGGGGATLARTGGVGKAPPELALRVQALAGAKTREMQTEQ